MEDAYRRIWNCNRANRNATKNTSFKYIYTMRHIRTYLFILQCKGISIFHIKMASLFCKYNNIFLIYFVVIYVRHIIQNITYFFDSFSSWKYWSHHFETITTSILFVIHPYYIFMIYINVRSTIFLYWKTHTHIFINTETTILHI